MEETKEIHNIRDGKFQWYRYKGDIKLRHLFAYKYLPFDYFDSNIINKLMEEIVRKHRSVQTLVRLNDMGLELPSKDDLFKEFPK